MKKKLKNGLKKIRRGLVKLLTPKEDRVKEKALRQAQGKKKEEIVASEILGLNNKPGINCPECGTRILTTIDMVLSRVPIECAMCGLKMNVEQEESKPALDSLRKLDGALKEAEKVSK
ncbi:MAG: hypothetical protein QNK23_13785 [Crocinitomicaceae bacterium]|nr:hypothetical protein [Crocinitomicaceae bacterium]